MSGQALSRLFLSLCALALACIVLTGAPRLIAGPQDGETAQPAATAQAYISAPAADAAQESAPSDALPRHSGERTAQAARLSAAPMPQLRCDANGHVLAAKESYLRAVYCAFALGDGFV